MNSNDVLIIGGTIGVGLLSALGLLALTSKYTPETKYTPTIAPGSDTQIVFGGVTKRRKHKKTKHIRK